MTEKFIDNLTKCATLSLVLALAGCSDGEPTISLEQRVADLRAAGDYPQAIAELRNAIREDPGNASLQRLQGTLFLDTEAWSLAEIALRKAVEAGVDDTATKLAMSRALFMQNKFEQTRDVLSELRYATNAAEIEGTLRLAKSLDKSSEGNAAKRQYAIVFKGFDRKALAHDDPVDTTAILAELETLRDDYTALDEVLGNRERLRNLPVGEWVTLHKQRVSDAVFFSRQDHGGGSFDTRRGQLILFGSDTHDYGDISGKNWKNNVFFFDPVVGEWSRSYARDPVDTYTVNADGIPVAGENGDRPWAMHTYGAVSYDARRDEMVVSSHPAHLEPGRFTYMLQEIWPKIERHPTWIFNLQDGQWRPLEADAESFFHNATAYDSDRGVIVGYRRDGVYELSGSPRSWRRVTDAGLLGPDNNLVYDSAHKAFVVFGNKESSNDIAVYEPATGRHRIMPTPGVRPPRDKHVPMAFHTGAGKSALLIQRKTGRDILSGSTETWLYDLGEDAWQRIETATLDFGIYRNYHLEYDSHHDILLFMPNQHGPMSLTKVMALRLPDDGMKDPDGG